MTRQNWKEQPGAFSVWLEDLRHGNHVPVTGWHAERADHFESIGGAQVPKMHEGWAYKVWRKPERPPQYPKSFPVWVCDLDGNNGDWYREEGELLRNRHGQVLDKVREGVIWMAIYPPPMIQRPTPEATCATVDWSKAPADAESFAGGKFYKGCGAGTSVWGEFGWEKSDDEAWEFPDCVGRPKVPWDGEGLPPVGVVCEYLSPKLSNWVKVKAVFSGSRIAVLEIIEGEHSGDESAVMPSVKGGNMHSNVRPIRTPEQIIADREREERIKAAQVWLEGITQEYGSEVADKCEDVLMEAEERKRAES